MALIRKTYLVTVEIDTEKARNFPGGFLISDGRISNGFNENSYPNWDINYLGDELSFFVTTWQEFKSRFEYDGLSCKISNVRFDF